MSEIIKRNLKEIKLEPTSKNFKATYGTVNRLEPSVIYVKLFCWAQHTDDIHEYKTNVIELNKNVKTKVRKLLRDTGVLNDLPFFNLNMKKVLFKENDSFHTSFEFTIRQKEPMYYDITEIKDIVENFVNKMIEYLELQNNFEFTVNKKVN